MKQEQQLFTNDIDIEHIFQFMPNFFPQFFALFEKQSNNDDNINWRADIVFKKK